MDTLIERKSVSLPRRIYGGGSIIHIGIRFFILFFVIPVLP